MPSDALEFDTYNRFWLGTAVSHLAALTIGLLGISGATVQMIRVNSTAIVAIGYDEKTSRLRIQFQQGHSYDFCRVLPNVHADFMRAYSKGGCYNDHIKDRYQC